MGAVEDAQRLATKVTRQQEQLEAYEQRIAALETQLRWYQIAFDLQSGEPARSGGDDPLENGLTTHDIDPQGKPATPPEGDLDGEEQPIGNRDVVETSDQVPGPPESSPENDESSPEEDHGSRIGRWLKRRWP
jgi:hypothetical protein